MDTTLRGQYLNRKRESGGIEVPLNVLADKLHTTVASSKPRE